MENSQSEAGFKSPTGGLFTTHLPACGLHSWGPCGSRRIISSCNPASTICGFSAEEPVLGSDGTASFPYVSVRCKRCLPSTSVCQRNDALMGQPRPLVPQPQGGRGQGGSPEENVDILIQRRRFEKQYSP